MSKEIAIVFGASGFLGSHVAEALSSDGYQVRLFDRTPSTYQLPDQEMIIGDIMNLKDVTKAAQGVESKIRATRNTTKDIVRICGNCVSTRA